MKTVGVIGGIGPQATMDFEARFHHIAQDVIPQYRNRGYPPMVVYYHRYPPVVLNDDSSPRLPLEPDPRLLDAARHLGAMTDFLVITSNAAHLIQDRIEEASGRKVLSMIEVVVEDVRRQGWSTVGVLGFGHPLVYTEPLEQMGIACETIGGDLAAKLDVAIMDVMAGRDDANSKAIAREAVEILRDKRVDGIILGCTEIPLLLGENAHDHDLANPVQLLAVATVKHSLVESAEGPIA